MFFFWFFFNVIQALNWTVLVWPSQWWQPAKFLV